MFTSRQVPNTLTLVLFAIVCSVTISSHVRTIHSPDGDIIDCVDKLDQPALKHPLLKNHRIQDMPINTVKTDDGFGWQVWHANGKTCPVGTVPIRRFKAQSSHKKYEPPIPDSSSRATKDHQYAIAYVIGKQFYGAKATLNVWDPIVESGDDFSLAQLWIRSGEYETNDINTVEAGWQVYPNRYGDHQPRLFTYWTRDAYINTGCYGSHCDGFIHVSSTIALEAALSPVSTLGRDQFAITIQIWKDPFSGNWWMAMGANLVPVGYWPAEIFTTLFDHATMIQWGGEVYYRNMSGTSGTVAQMGSGEYPDKGLQKAAYFCNIYIAEENRTWLPVQDFYMGVTQPDFYMIKKAHSINCGNFFFYGGPGPVRSASVRGVALSITLLIFSVFSVVLFF